MKKLLLSLAFLISGSITYSQNTATDIWSIMSYTNTAEKSLLEKINTGDVAGAQEEADQTLQWFNSLPEEIQLLHQNIPSGTYYNLGCVYAVSGQKQEAMDCIQKAFDLGLFNYYQYEGDSDLDSLREEPQFIELLSRAKEMTDYKCILKKFGKYGEVKESTSPDFTYQHMEEYPMRVVRKGFGFEEIAGDGDEFSRIVNLMKWVYYNIEYDGSNMPICSYNAIDLHNYAKAGDIGINCWAKAVLLNDIYLSMGYASRFVQCLSFDNFDNECHVINSVYSNSLGKWLWMDPSFGIYVMDENGTPLSIQEVRERIIKDLPLVLNEDSQYNGHAPALKKEYMDEYMSANLFWFSCMADSRFDAVSPFIKNENLYVNLIPEGYRVVRIYNNNFFTSDPDYFWQAPQTKH